jgi:hypothetical protein
MSSTTTGVRALRDTVEIMTGLLRDHGPVVCCFQTVDDPVAHGSMSPAHKVPGWGPPPPPLTDNLARPARHPILGPSNPKAARAIDRTWPGTATDDRSRARWLHRCRARRARHGGPVRCAPPRPRRPAMSESTTLPNGLPSPSALTGRPRPSPTDRSDIPTLRVWPEPPGFPGRFSSRISRAPRRIPPATAIL